MTESSVNDCDSFRLTVSFEAGVVEPCLSAFEDAGLDDYVLWQMEDSDECAVYFYRDTAEEVKLLKKSIRAEFNVCDISDGYTFAEDRIKAHEWENSWKEFFHAERLSERIVVRPSWETWQGGGSDIEIVIDPGMSFGTGLHQTTRACIRLLDKLSGVGGSLLDAGCGSGILSIAGVKLGFEPVLAIDNDPVAVQCASKNCEVNGVHDRIDLQCIPLNEINADRIYDVVAVNILANVIEENAGLIVSLLKPAGGHLALAGILNSQFDRIGACFEEYGLLLLERIDDGEWSSGLFQS